MKKILVVDDDLAILEVLKLVLEENDCKVFVSENGKISKIIDEFQPDMILLDVLLSGEDGRDIARRLKSDDKTRDIPLVMISAHPSADETAKQAGADEFIAKPFEIDHLLEIVNNNLR